MPEKKQRQKQERVKDKQRIAAESVGSAGASNVFVPGVRQERASRTINLQGLSPALQQINQDFEDAVSEEEVLEAKGPYLSHILGTKFPDLVDEGKIHEFDSPAANEAHQTNLVVKGGNQFGKDTQAKAEGLVQEIISGDKVINQTNINETVDEMMRTSLDDFQTENAHKIGASNFQRARWNEYMFGQDGREGVMQQLRRKITKRVADASVEAGNKAMSENLQLEMSTLFDNREESLKYPQLHVSNMVERALEMARVNGFSNGAENVAMALSQTVTNLQSRTLDGGDPAYTEDEIQDFIDMVAENAKLPLTKAQAKQSGGHRKTMNLWNHPSTRGIMASMNSKIQNIGAGRSSRSLANMTRKADNFMAKDGISMVTESLKSSATRFKNSAELAVDWESQIKALGYTKQNDINFYVAELYSRYEAQQKVTMRIDAAGTERSLKAFKEALRGAGTPAEAKAAAMLYKDVDPDTVDSLLIGHTKKLETAESSPTYKRELVKRNKMIQRLEGTYQNPNLSNARIAGIQDLWDAADDAVITARLQDADEDAALLQLYTSKDYADQFKLIETEIERRDAARKDVLAKLRDLSGRGQQDDSLIQKSVTDGLISKTEGQDFTIKARQAGKLETFNGTGWILGIKNRVMNGMSGVLKTPGGIQGLSGILNPGQDPFGDSDINAQPDIKAAETVIGQLKSDMNRVERLLHKRALELPNVRSSQAKVSEYIARGLEGWAKPIMEGLKIPWDKETPNASAGELSEANKSIRDSMSIYARNLPASKAPSKDPLKSQTNPRAFDIIEGELAKEDTIEEMKASDGFSTHVYNGANVAGLQAAWDLMINSSTREPRFFFDSSHPKIGTAGRLSNRGPDFRVTLSARGLGGHIIPSGASGEVVLAQRHQNIGDVLAILSVPQVGKARRLSALGNNPTYNKMRARSSLYRLGQLTTDGRSGAKLTDYFKMALPNIGAHIGSWLKGDPVSVYGLAGTTQEWTDESSEKYSNDYRRVLENQIKDNPNAHWDSKVNRYYISGDVKANADLQAKYDHKDAQGRIHEFSRSGMTISGSAIDYRRVPMFESQERLEGARSSKPLRVKIVAKLSEIYGKTLKLGGSEEIEFWNRQKHNVSRYESPYKKRK